MRRWTPAQLSWVLVLLCLLLLSEWLTQKGQRAWSGRELGRPGGFSAKGIELAQYGEGGQVDFRLFARQVTQPDPGGAAHLLQARLELDSPEHGRLLLDLPVAAWWPDAAQLHLDQGFRLYRPTPGLLPLDLSSGVAVVDTRQQQVSGQNQVRGRYANARFSAQRFRYDWRLRRLELTERVRLVYETN
jgi:lipopolysaccharide export system protein LptC